jgi:hypothetical protein
MMLIRSEYNPIAMNFQTPPLDRNRKIERGKPFRGKNNRFQPGLRLSRVKVSGFCGLDVMVEVP